MDIRDRIRNAQNKAKEVKVVDNRKVYPQFKHCPECKGTLQLSNGKPCDCRRKLIMNNLLKECGIEEGYYNVNFDFYDKMLYDAEVRTRRGLKTKASKRVNDIGFFTTYLKLYIDTFENRLLDGRGFIISGNCGGAKTGGATLLIKELCKKYYKRGFNSDLGDRRYSFYFIEANLIQDTISDSWDKESATRMDSKERLRKLRECDFLVIDDIGAEYSRNDAWIINIFLKLIKGRKSSNKPTVLTTNYSPDQLVERFSEELFPRLSSVLTEAMEVIVIDNPVDVRERLAESRSLADDMKKEAKPKR